MSIITRSIAKGDQYPGLLAHDLGGGREIVVIGWGEEAERILTEAVEARRAKDSLAAELEDCTT